MKPARLQTAHEIVHQCRQPMWRLRALLIPAVAPLLVMGGLTGCDRDDATIQSYSIAKTLPVGSPPDSVMAEMPAATPAAASAPPIHWTVPAEWAAASPAPGPAGIAPPIAAFKVSADHPELQATVSEMAPNQSLGDNVRRWERQVGLPETPDEQLGTVVKHLKLADAEVDAVDLIGPAKPNGAGPQHALAAMLPRPDATWFFKLMGPDSAVGGQAANFQSFVQSIHFDDAQASAAPAPPAPAGSESSSAPTAGTPITYTLPAGWAKQPNTTAMRFASFKLPGPGNESSLVIVSRFPQMPGPLVMNVNRWRQEAGLAEVDDASASPPVGKIIVGGSEGTRYQFAGDASAAPAKAVDAVMVQHGDSMWFFKLTGPAALVASQRASFDEFLHSIAFTGESH